MSLLPLKKKMIRAVFTDLDGTLTDEGRLTRESFSALCDLKDRGFFIAILSGRPAGSADCLIRLLPVDAVVFENGAGLVRNVGGRIETELFTSEGNRAVLEKAFLDLKERIPELKLAKDQAYRRFDYAIDFAEEPPFLNPATLSEVLKTLNAIPGVTAKQSSIHVNYWLGSHTKVDAARAILARERFSADSAVFCGDAPNDEPLFQTFENSVGVANIAPFLGSLTHPPRYLTKAPGGKGFRELVDCLIS